MDGAFLLRVMSGSERRFGTVIFDGRFDGGFVFSAIWFGIDAEELGDESLLIAVEAANIG